MQKLSTPYIKRRTGESESKRKWNNCDGDSSFLKGPWMSQQSTVQSLLINSVVDQHKREKKDCVTNIPVFATQLQKYSSPIEPFYIPSSHLHPGGNLSWFLGIYIIYVHIYISYMHIWVCVCDVCTVCVCGYICPCVGAEARREHQVFCFTMGWGYRCLATPHFSYGYWDLKSCRTHTPLSYLFSPCF